MLRGWDRIRGVVFDLDDTLFPEWDFVRGGLRAVAEAFADVLGPPDAGLERLWRLYTTGDRARVFDAALADTPRTGDRELIARMVTVYRTHRPRLRLFEDAERALTRLRPARRVGLLSDGPAESQRNKVEAMGLVERVDALVLTDELGRDYWKPDRRAFERIAAQLGLPHEALAYVGDNPEKDFIAPNALGWATIHIARPGGVYAGRAAAPGGEPGHVIGSLDNLGD